MSGVLRQRGAQILRHGTEAEFLALNPILTIRDAGLIEDTGEIVFGNGEDQFDDLPRIALGGGGGGGYIQTADLWTDEFGNWIAGAANVAAFPTDRAGELSDIHVDSTATFVPPAAGVEVHGLKVHGAATVDLSALADAASVVRSVIVLNMPVTLGDSGKAMTLDSCVFQQANLNGLGHVSILTGGTYRGIQTYGGDFDVDAGLAGVYRVDGYQMWGGTFHISGDANVTCQNVVQPGDADLAFSSATSATQLTDVTTTADADISNSAAGSGYFHINFPAGIIGRAQHNTDIGSTGRTIIDGGYGFERMVGVVGVVHRGGGNGHLHVSGGSGEVEVDGLFSNLTVVESDGSRIIVNDAGTGASDSTFTRVKGPGTVTVTNLGSDVAASITLTDVEVGVASELALQTIDNTIQMESSSLTGLGGTTYVYSAAGTGPIIITAFSADSGAYLDCEPASGGSVTITNLQMSSNSKANVYPSGALVVDKVSLADEATADIYNEGAFNIHHCRIDSGAAIGVGIGGSAFLAVAGAVMQYSDLHGGASLYVSGDSQIANVTLGAIFSVDTNGFDMTRCVGYGSGSVTLAGDNTDHFSGFGLNQIV